MTKPGVINGRKDSHTISFIKSHTSLLYKVGILYLRWEITSSVTLRKGRRLRVFENRVVKKIFGSTKAWVTREWRRLHNEELYDLLTTHQTHG
jgi:hypothetical protein